jgi:signal transduction histidine kinase
MSHELRTPLNGILGYSELLLEDAKDKEHWQYAQAIHDSGRHLLGMVDSILDLSALESGHTVMQYRPVQIDSLLQNVVGAYRQAAIDKNLALESEVTADVPADIVCDSQKVTHVLGHLLHNAIRFTDHGRVRINVSRQADVVLFEVSDSGVGIPAKLHQRIFDKFFQADESDTRSNEGAGIGLSISKHLVTLMGGHIFVQSNAGAGSKFGFTLPLNPGACATH